MNRFKLRYSRGVLLPIEIPNFGRDNLPQLFNELGFRKGAEIGVERGYFSEVILNNSADIKLYSIDPWKVYSEYPDHTDQGEIERCYQETCARLAPYKNCKIIRKFSLDAVNDFANDSIDFVYIDANHSFQSVTNDICEWQKKVRPGGIVSGHDFMGGKEGIGIQVKQAVIGYTEAAKIRPWFVLGSQQRIRGQIRDNSRSWMWVKRGGGQT